MVRQVALYLCASTDGKRIENQRRELEEIAQRKGWEIAKVYADRGSREAKRQGLNRLNTDAGRGKFDLVMAWSVDPLGRSFIELLGFLKGLRDLKIDLYLHEQDIDTTTREGKAIFQMCSVFVDFQHALSRAPVHTGLAGAKAQGKTLGRPRIKPETEQAIRDDLVAGRTGIQKIAGKYRVGVSVVQRIKRELRASTVRSRSNQ